MWPKLFERPIIGGLVRQIERASILVLVGSMLFQLSTGLLNIAQWYAFKFFFTTSHYAMSYVAAGAVLVHIAVKLPIIRRALGEPLDDIPTGELIGPSRRTVLRGTWLAVAIATVVTAGQTIPLLRKVSVLAPRSGQGPQGVPVNRSAVAARGAAERPVTGLPVDGDERVDDAGVHRRRTGGHAAGHAQPADLMRRRVERRAPSGPVWCWPIWSKAVGGKADSDVRMISLEPPGPYSRTVLPARHARDSKTLIALKINGETLNLDHGYPCRLIAPTRPGVLQTKWLTRIEVVP